MGQGIKTQSGIREGTQKDINKSNPPRGRLPLDVIPFQFMDKPKDIISIVN